MAGRSSFYTVELSGGAPVTIYAGSNEPLIVVDGITIESFNVANNVIHPRMIKSVTIDKVGAIYGARGAAGAIIITTFSVQELLDGSK